MSTYCNSGETTPTGMLTPSTVSEAGTETNFPDGFKICTHKEPETDEDILQRIAELRLKLSEPKKSLISPLPDVTKRHPAFGCLSFKPVSTVLRITPKVDIPYVTSREVSVSKPGVVVAIKGFSKPHTNPDLCVFVTPTNFRDSLFDLHFTGWTANELKHVDVDWLEVPKEHTKTGIWQHGEHEFDFATAAAPEFLISFIKFSRPFISPPNVVVWLSGIHTDGATNLRIECTMGDIKSEGFYAVARSWDTKLYSVKISWVAYDSNLKGVYSKKVSTTEFRTSAQPQHFNTQYTAFPPGQFTKAPKVMVGATYIYQAYDRDQNVKVFASDITHLGMNWNANSWGNTINHQMGLTYLAIED
ncbi:hypothetical protein BJ508DRAFT_417077 [Ascobolus immersus RN42]|uniref:H-type lectin domain-containing protein n=1 Tax=Ascobolus immersus RN42 TaxID=1160509 RepID=A0A3N4HUG5_ASCIM|nr:hypothetical protein BJ508DRAFT_417077 [Ascobolus immersus RN42]